MSDSEDEFLSQLGNASNYKGGSDDDDDDDDDEPSTSWGLKRRKHTVGIISDSENDDDDDAPEDLAKDDVDSCDSDSSGGAPGAETCAICLGRMRGEVGSPNSCEHTFCKFCILEWAKNNPTCPQDRKPFSEIVVRKTLGGPIEKNLPVEEKKDLTVYDFVLENPTYCEVCNECDREERLLLCDGCDLGYHLECLDPPLSEVPVEEWFCPECTSADVPKVLTYRRRVAASHPADRERRGSSSSGRVSQQPEAPRIPRTRATERIRAHIQKKKIKKKLKRKRQRDTRKAKLASGELEDNRPPGKSLNEFRVFHEQDADIDATHNEDKYADWLLAGAVVESYHRQPSQRRADALRRLRDVSFIPQASYSGRAKNRILEVVNTQSNDNQSDVLSGILENQAIAFSSSKKLVLTNDRKLTKQPGIEIGCKIFQEEDSFLSEPLPSQRKTPERSDTVDSSGDEKTNPILSKEKIEEDTSVSKSSRDYHSASKQQSHPRSADQHASDHRREWRKDYSHDSYSRDGPSGSRHGDHVRNRYHNQRRHDHRQSRYSSYDRHSSSSWRKRSPPKHLSYGRSEKHSYDRNDLSERRFGSHQNRDYSPGKRKTSVVKESRENSWRSGVSKYDKYDGNRPNSSKSSKSDSGLKGKSSLSSMHGENHHRSQWSYSYFNSENLFTRRNGSQDSVKSSSNKVDDIKLSGSEGIAKKSDKEPKESSSSFTDSSVRNSSYQKTKPSENNESMSSCSSNIIPLGSICAVSDSELCAVEKSIVKVYETEVNVNSESVNKVDKESDVMSTQEVSCRLKSVYSSPHPSGTDRPCIQSKVSADTLAAESEGKKKCPFKSSFGKKTRLAFLFGDTDYNSEDAIEIKKDQIDEDNKSMGKEICQKSDEKVKTIKFSNEDIDYDDDIHVNTAVKPRHELFESEMNLDIPKISKHKKFVAGVEPSCEEEIDFSRASKEDMYGKKNQDKWDLPNKYDYEKYEKLSKNENALPRHIKDRNEKHSGRKGSFSKHSKEVIDVGKKVKDVLRKDVKDVGEINCHYKKNSSGKQKKQGQENIIQEDALRKFNKFSDKFDDGKCSSSKHSKEKITSGSLLLKGNDIHVTDCVVKSHDKNALDIELESRYKVIPSSDKHKATDISNSISESSDKKRKIETETVEFNYSREEIHKHDKKKKNKIMVYSDLFGDIEDIDSSSNSNLPEVEGKTSVNFLCNATVKTKEKPTGFKGEVCDGKGNIEVEQVSETQKDLSSIQDDGDVEHWSHTKSEDLASGRYCTSKYKASCGTKLENDLRIKQQKASLEVKVVQEVKKYLDPYYRNKSITKDEYKQIVAKCVRKVVSAECGDIIEPEKMYGLVVGYIKLFKHRQMKSKT